jgi:hypothetical protein
MEVIATARGYLGAIREPGDVFEVEDGLTGSWFKPTETSGKAPEKSPKQKPRKGGDPSLNDAGDDPII